MKNILFLFVAIIIFAGLYSCDEIENAIDPKDDYLIDKKVAPSETETILTKGNDIQIIIPGGALTEDATFKVEKASNPPEMNMDKMLLGKNVFKINISGQSNFDKPIQIVINYSQSKLDDNDLTDDDVRGLIYKNGSWAEATYTLDKENKKIIISITTPTGKIKSEGNIPLADGEIMIGDGYSMTDSGDKDLLVLKSDNFQIFTFIPVAYETKSYDHNGKLESTVYDTTYIRNDFFTAMPYTIAWSGLTFSIDQEFESRDIYFTGSISEDGNMIESLSYDYRDDASQLLDETLELKFSNVPLDNILEITENIFYIDYQVKSEFNKYLVEFYHKIIERTPNADGVWIKRKEITGSLLGAYPDNEDYLLFRFR